MTTTVEANPTVARRRLAVYLNKQRQQHGFDLDKLAGILEVDLSQASRLDTGARGFRLRDVETLCDVYGLDATEKVRLLALAKESRKRAWWQQLNLPDSVRTFIGMEQAAIAISEFAGSSMPGLLQTREYAEVAAHAAGGIDLPDWNLKAAIDARMRRQQILIRPNPPELWVVLDESVLARVAGGPDVMRRQLEHLRAMASRPRITIQVVSFEYGIYASWSQHFQILAMGDLPDVVFTEDLLKHTDTTAEEAVQATRRVWDLLRAQALSPRDSLQLVDRYITHRDRTAGTVPRG